MPAGTRHIRVPRALHFLLLIMLGVATWLQAESQKLHAAETRVRQGEAELVELNKLMQSVVKRFENQAAEAISITENFSVEVDAVPPESPLAPIDSPLKEWCEYREHWLVYAH